MKKYAQVASRAIPRDVKSTPIPPHHAHIAESSAFYSPFGRTVVSVNARFPAGETMELANYTIDSVKQMANVGVLEGIHPSQAFAMEMPLEVVTGLPGLIEVRS